MSSLANQRIQRVDLHWPTWGTARAEVSTVAGSVPLGPAVLVVGDLSLAGTVTDGGLDSAESWHGVWENGAGWKASIAARSYGAAPGVKISTVLKDLAADCGAPGVALAVAMPPDRAMGVTWARPGAWPGGRAYTGRDELARLVRGGYAPPSWWIDALGVLTFGARPGGAVGGKPRVLSRDLAAGQRVLAVDSVKAFAPGGTWEGATIARVWVRENAGKLTLETWEA